MNLRLVLVLILVVVFVPRVEASYLDPGTGSMLLQGLIALVAGALATLAGHWRIAKRVVCRVLKRASTSGSASKSDDENSS